MLKNSLPKEERIYLRNEINKLFSSRDSFVCYPFRVLYLWVPYQEGYPSKVLVSVPKKKLKHAVDRNRIKRLLKEAYRQNKHALQESIEQMEDKRTLLIAFIYLPEKVSKYSKVLKATIEALESLRQTIESSSAPCS